MSKKISRAGHGAMSKQLSNIANFIERLVSTKLNQYSVHENYSRFRSGYSFRRFFRSHTVSRRRDAILRDAFLSFDIHRMETGTSGYTCWRQNGRARRRPNKGRPVRSAFPLPDGYHIASHTHGTVTVISGNLYLAPGETLDRNSAKNSPPYPSVTGLLG